MLKDVRWVGFLPPFILAMFATKPPAKLLKVVKASTVMWPP